MSLLSSWQAFPRYIFYNNNKKVIYKQAYASSPSASASTDVEIVRHPKNLSFWTKNMFLTGKKKNYFLCWNTTIRIFSNSCISFFDFCLKEKLFHWNKQCKKIERMWPKKVFGKDAIAEDVYTWIRVSAQQWVSFDPTEKSTALLTTSGFFSGEDCDVASLPSWLQGWTGREQERVCKRTTSIINGCFKTVVF